MIDSDNSQRRDPTLAVAIETLVLTVPSAVLATLQLMDRIDQKRLATQIKSLGEKLLSKNCDGVLEIEGVGRVDLARDSTAVVADLLLREQGA